MQTVLIDSSTTSPLRLHSRARFGSFASMGKDEYGLQTQAGCDGAVFPTTRMTDIDGEPKAQSKLFSSSGLVLVEGVRNRPGRFPIASFLAAASITSRSVSQYLRCLAGIGGELRGYRDEPVLERTCPVIRRNIKGRPFWSRF